jgi:hypothetical protein
MRSVSKAAQVCAWCLPVLVVLLLPAGTAVAQSLPTDPLEHRVRPPVGVPSSSRVQPPVGTTSQPHGRAASGPTLLGLWFARLRTLISVPLG